MAIFSGNTAKPELFNGTRDSGRTDTVAYNNSAVGVTLTPGDATPALPRYADSYGNTMFAIEGLTGSRFNDSFSFGYDLSRGAPVTVFIGSPIERNFLLSVSMGDGNDIVNILNRLPKPGFFDLGWPDSGGFSSFDGAVVGGGAGDDTINGGSMADQIAGGLGSDRLRGGGGDDIIDTGGGGIDRVAGGRGDDNITVTKFSLDDITEVNGNEGRDTIILSKSFASFDNVVISALSDSAVTAKDTIWNFDPTTDFIDLSAIDANSRQRGNQAFDLVQNFSGRAGELQFDFKANGGTFTQTTFTGDTNGDGVADFGFVLIAALGVTAATTALDLQDGFVL